MPLTKRQREILNYLDTYAGQNGYAPSFEEIADHFNVSLRQLYRVSAVAGYTPAALVWRRRLERARTLLHERGSRAPITEIALSCGFKDGAHFSRSYRKTFGEAPRAARRGPGNGEQGAGGPRQEPLASCP